MGPAGGPICREAGSGPEQEFQQSGSTGQEENEGSGWGGGSSCHAQWWSPSKLKGMDFNSLLVGLRSSCGLGLEVRPGASSGEGREPAPFLGGSSSSL